MLPLVLLFVLAPNSPSAGSSVHRPNAAWLAVNLDAPSETNTNTPPPADVATPRPLDPAAWWMHFGDEALDRIVHSGLTGNIDVKVAQERIEEARALQVQALAPLLPTASWDTTLALGPLQSLGFQFGGGVGPGGGIANAPSVYYRASSTVNGAFEIDLAGRNVLGYKAARLDTKAADADLGSQRLTLARNIATTYYDLVTANARLAVLEQQVIANEEVLELTELRFQTGQATAVDVLQQRQQLAATRALVPQARTQIAVAKQQLAVLLGLPPGRDFAAPEHLPTLSPLPLADIPDNLADVRPELQAARFRVESARARLKSARRAFAPTLRLTGEAGYQAIRLVEWRSQSFWGAGATVSIPISTGGLTWGRLQQSRAQARIASNQLEQQRLDVLREVREAQVRERLQREALTAFVDASEAAQLAFEKARERYATGLSEFLTVLTALNAAQQAQLNLITAHRDLVVARIDLLAALGEAPR